MLHSPDPPFELCDGQPYYCNLPVEFYSLKVADYELSLAGLHDAADLLDQPDFARRFLESNLAPYGLQLWPAAHMLADYVAREPVLPRTAVELGAGLGLVSIVAALRGWAIHVTDQDKTALAFARYNASLNAAPIAGFAQLDWNHPPDRWRRHFGCVLAADVLYQLTDFNPILRCLLALLGAEGFAAIADPGRSIADVFPDAATHAGFRVEVCSASACNHAGKKIEGRIFILRSA